MVGRSQIAPEILGCSELLPSLCTCTYVPNAILQYLTKSLASPVIRVLGLIVVYTTTLCGKLFSHNTMIYTISAISLGRYFLKEFAIALTLPLLSLNTF